MRGWSLATNVAIVAFACLLVGCEEKAPPTAEARPVRTVVVGQRPAGEPVVLTGQVRARTEINLAFRLSGHMIDRTVRVGDQVTPGQVIAHLDDQIQKNTVLQTEALLSAARAQLVEARNTFARQNGLLSKGFASNAQFDQAQQALDSAEAQVKSAEAQVKSAEEQLSYTILTADTAGTVITTGAEAGEVVAAGQPVVQIASDGGRDAVFAVSGQIIRALPEKPAFTVALTEDTAIGTSGHIREIAPQADPVTRTYTVKVALDNPPEAMQLGSTVSGTTLLDAPAGMEVPSSAIVWGNGASKAVWVVDTQALTVSLRNVEVARYEPSSVILSGGLQPGETIVTAGVQSLHQGQTVRLLGSAS
jgi:RND family efflux transporter MFP subunit